MEAEENPDDLPDLVAELLTNAVAKRQRQQLSLGYRTREAALSRVRGKIDVLATERGQLLARGLVACRFEELTIDTPRNRFVRGALNLISGIVRRPALALRCKKLAGTLRDLGVSDILPTISQLSVDRVGPHDAHDLEMIAAAKLAFDLALPTEIAGGIALSQPDREEAWARRLFERAVGGFFEVVLPSGGWTVRTGGRLEWQVDWCTANIPNILPGMQTDIVLSHSVLGRRIVIDTKFNSLLTSGWYRDDSIRNAYLYQIYAYLRSQAGRGDALADTADGILLHPSVGGAIDETVVVQGHSIRFMTVDLTDNSAEIRANLLRATGTGAST